MRLGGGLYTKKKMQNTPPQCDRELNEFKGAMSEAIVGLEGEVRRKIGLENDSDATLTGGAWEGPDSVAAGSQEGDLCLIPVGAEQVSVKDIKSIALSLM